MHKRPERERVLLTVHAAFDVVVEKVLRHKHLKRFVDAVLTHLHTHYSSTTNAN